MGALGAGAGVFEGAVAREEIQNRKAGLGLQEAALAQRDRQFSEGMAFDREKMAADEREDAAMRQERVNDASVRQSNADRDFGLQEKQFQAGQEKDLYQRGRDEIKDAWGQAIDEQTLLEKQERIRTNRLQFEELDRASKMEREQLANRQRLAKTGLGALALSAARNGGVASKSAIEIFNKQQEAAGTGVKVSGGVWSAEGFAFKRVGPAVDQNGNPVQGQMMEYDEMMPSAIANPLLKDEFGEDMSRAQENEAQNAFNLKRDQAGYDAYLKREEIKAERTLDPKTKIRYSALQAEHRDAMRALRKLNPQDDPEGYKAAQDEVDALENDMVAIEVGAVAQKEKTGSKLGLVKPGAGAGYPNQDGFAPDVIAESERVKKLAMSKPENQRKDFYNGEMKKYIDSRGTVNRVSEQGTTKTQQRIYESPAEQASVIEKQKQASDSHYGPASGDVAYWRDMPTGSARQVFSSNKIADKKEIKRARYEILARIEKAYRLPRGAEKESLVKKLEAERDAFNSKYPL